MLKDYVFVYLNFVFYYPTIVILSIQLVDIVEWSIALLTFCIIII